ncbi:MAG: PAS domain-containing protein [Bacteroidetes bacterium]|nr:PAS domain-containing protein [Bacteroidota bacterium]
MSIEMIRKKKTPSIDKLALTHPQKAAVTRILTATKNKYKKLLHETHERMHIIADMTSSLEFWFNVNGRFEYVSPSVTAVLGFEPRDFIEGGLLLEKLVHEDMLERFRADRTRALAGESGTDQEYRLHTKDGDTRYVLMTWSPVLTRNGKHIGVRISLRDISEYRRCQHFAQAYEQLALAIADELPYTGVFSLTPDHFIKTWSVTCAKLFGWSGEEALGRSLGDLFGAETDILLEGLDALECSGRFDTNILLHARDQKEIGVRIIALSLCDVEKVLHQYTFLVYPLT